jgi:Glutamyl-tRNA reductase
MNSVITDELKLLNVRITHKKAPIHVLEKFTFKDIAKAYRIFLTSGDIRECVILQTCNRVEIFLALDKIDVEKSLRFGEILLKSEICHLNLLKLIKIKQQLIISSD